MKTPPSILNYVVLKNPKENSCVRRVTKDSGTWFSQGQCSRSPKEEFKGFSFCSQHAQELKKLFGEAEVIRIIFVVESNFTLSKVPVLQETPKSFDVDSSKIEILFGNRYHSIYGKVLKSERWFSTIEEAIDCVEDLIKESVRTCYQKIEELNKLSDDLITLKFHHND